MKLYIKYSKVYIVSMFIYILFLRRTRSYLNDYCFCCTSYTVINLVSSVKVMPNCV